MSDQKHTAIVAAPHAELTRMHPVVSAAIAAGADATQLRELLAIQRDWEAGEARKSFTRAMVALKRELPTVLDRDSVVDYSSTKGRTRYTHTSLAAAVTAVTEPLTNHGFSVAWVPRTTDRMVEVTCRITHSDGHSEETTIAAPPDTSGSKSPAQAVASTITLLQRYAMLSLLGIATADMADPTHAAEPPRDGVDTARNMRAAAHVEKQGRTRAEAERHLGRPVAEWTGADLDKLRAWIDVPRKAQERQPGEDDR